MPRMPVLPIASGEASTTFVAAGGETATVSLPLNPAATSAQITSALNSIADLSNAGQIARTVTTTERISVSNAKVFDEAFSSAGMKMVLVFQNGDLFTVQIAIPAPDISYFTADGVTVNTLNSVVQQAVSQILVVLNAGDPAGTFALVRGYRSDRARRLPRPRNIPTLSEPTGAELPPPAPGN